MQEQKRNRIAAAFTVSVILLVAVFVVMLVYQMIFMAGQANREKELQREVENYQQKLDESKNDLEYLKSEDFLFDVALELGFRFPDVKD